MAADPIIPYEWRVLLFNWHSWYVILDGWCLYAGPYRTRRKAAQVSRDLDDHPELADEVYGVQPER